MFTSFSKSKYRGSRRERPSATLCVVAWGTDRAEVAQHVRAASGEGFYVIDAGGWITTDPAAIVPVRQLLRQLLPSEGNMAVRCDVSASDSNAQSFPRADEFTVGCTVQAATVRILLIPTFFMLADAIRIASVIIGDIGLPTLLNLGALVIFALPCQYAVSVAPVIVSQSCNEGFPVVLVPLPTPGLNTFLAHVSRTRIEPFRRFGLSAPAALFHTAMVTTPTDGVRNWTPARRCC